MALLIMYLFTVLHITQIHVMYISTSGFISFVRLASGVLPLEVQDWVLDLMLQAQGTHPP